MKDTPGFRFYPTEEELISFYLQHKLQATREADIDRVIPVVNIYDYNPWDLPQMSGEGCRSDDPQVQEWFFFIPKQEREVRGGRPNRLTTTGYWKATGSPGYVYSSSSDDKNKIIGVKRTMVFYRGRAPTRSGSSKTQWKMNEYMAIDHHHHHHQPSSSSTNPAPSQKGDYTVCRVYIKSNCLRAFDRRPGAPLINRRALQVDQPCPSDHHQAQPTVEIIRCNSSESSSSSGDHRLQLNNNNNNNNTDYDNDPLDQGTNNTNEQQERISGMEIDEHEPLWDWDSLMMNWNL